MVDAFEKRSSYRAMAISAGVHAILLLLLIFIVAWRAPNPPNPEYGIVLNFGVDDQGTGTVQPSTPVGSEEAVSQEPVAEEMEDVSTPEQTEVTEEDAVPESLPVDPEITSKVESPEVVEEKKEDIKTTPKDSEKPTEQKEEVKPTEDPLAVYQPNTKSDSEGSADSKTGEPQSQGDSKNATGDKGDREGSLDADALYGKQGGGGGGPTLELAGWQWDHIPRPEIPDNEPSGRIVFTIEVDENGELLRYRKESGTVSAAAERMFVEAIQKLTFTKKSGAAVPPISKGRISFVIRAE